MTDQPYGRRLSDKIKAAWQHALDMGRDEIADRLGLLYEATIQHESERFPRRRRDKVADTPVTKLTTPDNVRSPAGSGGQATDNSDPEKK